MIRLTRLNHKPIIINSDLIEHIDMAPDTVLWLTSGQTFMVLETAEEVVEKVTDFQRTIRTGRLDDNTVSARTLVTHEELPAE